MAKGGDTRAKARANGTKVGRPQKHRLIAPPATKSIATEVLAMDGPPDHHRKCDCRHCSSAKDCQCRKTEGGIVQCEDCKTRVDHKVCRCELCRWWEHRLSSDKRIRYDADVYLTNRRDGKPAESVIAEGKLVIEVIEKDGRADSPSAEAEALSKIM